MKRRAVTGGKGRNEERGEGETAKRTKGTPEHTHTRALTLWASECVCWLFFYLAKITSQFLHNFDRLLTKNKHENLSSVLTR